MKSKEEFKNRYKLASFRNYAEELIDAIYKDIGTCGECKYGHKYGDNIECGMLDEVNKPNWYCADFKRKAND